jgi:YHS domain-containing protein
VASLSHAPTFTITISPVALEGYCPVAYFAANKPILGSPEHASTYDGVTYHFVNADAKRMFDNEPEKYLPAYGGWCAFGMAIGDKFPVDPRTFKIVNGRLMLFLKNPSVDALDLWNDGDDREQTRKADAHWAKVNK